MKRIAISTFLIFVVFLAALVPSLNQSASASQYADAYAKYEKSGAAGAIDADMWVDDMTVRGYMSYVKQYVQIENPNPISGLAYEIGYIKGHSTDWMNDEDTGYDWGQGEYTGTQWYAMRLDPLGPITQTDFLGSATTNRDGRSYILYLYWRDTMQGVACEPWWSYIYYWDCSYDWDDMRINCGVEEDGYENEYYGHFYNLSYWIPYEGWDDWNNHSALVNGPNMWEVSNTEFLVWD